MHVENEASVSEPPCGKAKQAWQCSVITGALKSLLFSTWEPYFSKDNTSLFQQETQTPNGTQKVLVSLPSLEEPKFFKGLNQEKGVGDYTWFPWILTASPLYYTRKMRLAHGQMALSSGIKSWTHVSFAWAQTQRHQTVSHMDRGLAPQKKARVLRMNRKQWKTNRCARLGNGYFLQSYWVLSLNQIQTGKMFRALSVTNELLESCCLLVLTMELWRDFNPSHTSTPPPLHRAKIIFRGHCPLPMSPNHQGDTFKISLPVFLLPSSGTR